MPITGKASKLGLVVFLTSLMTALPASAAEIMRPLGVVELFTSQGCNSCPPADRVLGEIARGKDDVLALAWHVDYWDYLGWKDTFASELHTERQRGYARAMSKRSVYTPQAVINGRVDVVGSRGKSVMIALDELAGSANGLTVPIDAEIKGNMLSINIENSTKSAGATLWMVYFNKQRDVVIKRGENRGKTFTYNNIVREIEMIGMVQDHDLQAGFSLEDISRRGHDSCALILQKKTPNGDPGPIVGAAFLKDLGV